MAFPPSHSLIIALALLERLPRHPRVSSKGALMAAWATSPRFLAGARGVRLLPRVGRHPVRRLLATRGAVR